MKYNSGNVENSPFHFQEATTFFEKGEFEVFCRFVAWIILTRHRAQSPSSCWELSTRNSTGSKVLVYIPRVEGRSRRRIRGSNPLTIPRPYRRTSSSRTPRSCLERENDPRPRSNSVDRVLGRQGSAGRNFKTRLTKCWRYGGGGGGGRGKLVFK